MLILALVGKHPLQTRHTRFFTLGETLSLQILHFIVMNICPVFYMY